MSEVKNSESVYVPALFPKAGRLPTDPQMVSDNYDLKMDETEQYRQRLNARAGCIPACFATLRTAVPIRSDRIRSKG
ncbi:hypothetical protein RGV33_18935 [Pseudomonas sp. Bout1]|uniref:hypothetical protein n=1 Tax=Pseudomonas sp. Bout1 TaxID=3048600 RepID=UPI002AB54839|nr:hypothetical protein [Pseudomonas sp. Bout1]MDY7533735.1 hypothetical protein [Pseudomonas sp. Bout1]MEB0189616.1 hypothetical protein [Pseudomonas sp. Bout1]